ncbi:MAG TPA: hypothetical protein VNE67_09170 [Acetobacteraceae bacterium]|nr:hypothetical protein [Acetobacteraceae bacterium]
MTRAVLAALILAGTGGVIAPPLAPPDDPCLGLAAPVSIVCTGDDGVAVNGFCPGAGRPWTLWLRARDCGDLGRFT